MPVSRPHLVTLLSQLLTVPGGAPSTRRDWVRALDALTRVEDFALITAKLIEHGSMPYTEVIKCLCAYAESVYPYCEGDAEEIRAKVDLARAFADGKVSRQQVEKRAASFDTHGLGPWSVITHRPLEAILGVAYRADPYRTIVDAACLAQVARNLPRKHKLTVLTWEALTPGILAALDQLSHGDG